MSNVTVTANVVSSVDETGKAHRFACVTERQARLLALVLERKVEDRDIEFCRSISKTQNPSRSQMEWVDKKLEKYTVGQGAVVTPVKKTAIYPTILMKEIDEMFAHVRQALKRPKITLVLDETNPNQLVRLAYDHERGVIWLRSKTFGQNYGRILIATGEVLLKDYGKQVEPKLLALLKAFSEDPQGLAIRHGKLTGNCMFCQLKLSDERSLHHGYGKRCARNYGLVWGERPDQTPVGHWVLGDK